jgi:hypothetical protein
MAERRDRPVIEGEPCLSAAATRAAAEFGGLTADEADRIAERHLRYGSGPGSSERPRPVTSCDSCGEEIGDEIVNLGYGFVEGQGWTRQTLLHPACWEARPDGRRVPEFEELKWWSGWTACTWCDRRVYCPRGVDGTYRRRYCCDACRKAAGRARWRHPRECAGCRAWFAPARRDARFCSGACRQFAYRQRKRAPASDARGGRL